MNSVLVSSQRVQNMLSNSEILLDQVFRVWIRGDGYDYHVVLTPVRYAHYQVLK